MYNLYQSRYLPRVSIDFGHKHDKYPHLSNITYMFRDHNIIVIFRIVYKNEWTFCVHTLRSLLSRRGPKLCVRLSRTETLEEVR